ncbi:thioredoxin family protein [Flavihumibacter sp. R14]|nr:thioredoxin family protein [Flavihumibacter soli]
MNKIIAALFLLVQIGTSAGAQVKSYEPGSLVSDFKLKNVNNKQVSLADFSGAKGYIIVFTCNTCPYAKAYEQRIIDLHNKYAEKGYPVIAINPNDPEVSPGDSFAAMQERSTSKKYPFPYLIDQDQTVTRRFGATRTPHVFLVDKTNEGNKVAYIGAIDNDTEDNNPDKIRYVEKAIGALMSEKAPETTVTKAVGCTIKWKKGTGTSL